MKNKKTIKNILIGLLLAIGLLIGYAVVTDGQNSEGSVSTSLSSLIGSGALGQIQESDTDLANVEILRILGNIQNISLEDDIFQNPVFRELEDSQFSIPKPVRIGRPNPFLPIGFDTMTTETETAPIESGQIEFEGFFDN
jgi:hypothetical protein